MAKLYTVAHWLKSQKMLAYGQGWLFFGMLSEKIWGKQQPFNRKVFGWKDYLSWWWRSRCFSWPSPPKRLLGFRLRRQFHCFRNLAVGLRSLKSTETFSTLHPVQRRTPLSSPCPQEQMRATKFFIGYRDPRPWNISPIMVASTPNNTFSLVGDKPIWRHSGTPLLGGPILFFIYFCYSLTSRCVHDSWHSHYVSRG